MIKRLPGMRETQVPCLSWEDPLEKEMATHSSILALKKNNKKKEKENSCLENEEPGGLQSMGSQRVGQD